MPARLHVPTAVVLASVSLAVILFCADASPDAFPDRLSRCLPARRSTVRFQLPVETIGTQIRRDSARVCRRLPSRNSGRLILPLLPSAFTVALLAAVESLLSAVVADGMSGDQHNSNVELVAQGVANIVSPMFGGIPATGAIARTATNIRSGAQTPVAGIVHALTLLTHSSGRRAPGPFHPVGDAGRGAVRGRLQHGRVAEIGAILRLSKRR